MERIVQAEISAHDAACRRPAACSPRPARPTSCASSRSSYGRSSTDLWDGLELTAERRFELGEIPEGTLRADPDRLAQALRNLARNAIEHTSEGTGLVRDRGAAAVRETGSFSPCSMTGPGFPPTERERVFDRLYRTDLARSRRAGGSGLGLAIVRAIAEAHGGTARAVDPGPRGGARIELELPRWSGADAMAPQSS